VALRDRVEGAAIIEVDERWRPRPGTDIYRARKGPKPGPVRAKTRQKVPRINLF